MRKSHPQLQKREKYIQQVLGSLLYCAHTLDLTILHALPAIASEQAKPTKQNLGESVPVIALHDNKPKCSKQIFFASDMILNLQSDASYLSAGEGRSRAGWYFFLASIPRDNQNIQLNGNIHITCTIIKLVAALVPEVELGAPFQCLRIRSTGYQANSARVKPSTSIYTNSCGQHCSGRNTYVMNNTIRRQQSKATEICKTFLASQSEE